MAIIAGVIIPTALSAVAQSSDALLNKRVEKGILTSDEASQLKVESDQNFSTATASKIGLPDWVTSLRFSGDFRGRYNVDSSDNSAYTTRTRWRYRAWFGFAVTMQDDSEMGVRLASGDADSGSSSGYSPLTSYQTAQNNASKKGVFIDLAYGKWTLLHTDEWKGSVAIGKLPDPFVFSEVGLGMDPDYTPEGAAWQVERRLTDVHTVR